MLESPQERVKLLKAGVTGKTIEQIYIAENNFKIVRSPICLKTVKIDTNKIANVPINQMAAIETC
ncbi:MAG: hypothetical protein O8C63_03215 [Candidatus Methanoperedens sp.]|nr:hypothetical protein [Candidatus Methanoperedens sp.]